MWTHDIIPVLDACRACGVYAAVRFFDGVVYYYVHTQVELGKVDVNGVIFDLFIGTGILDRPYDQVMWFRGSDVAQVTISDIPIRVDNDDSGDNDPATQK